MHVVYKHDKRSSIYKYKYNSSHKQHALSAVHFLSHYKTLSRYLRDPHALSRATVKGKLSSPQQHNGLTTSETFNSSNAFIDSGR